MSLQSRIWESKIRNLPETQQLDETKIKALDAIDYEDEMDVSKFERLTKKGAKIETVLVDSKGNIINHLQNYLKYHRN